jgi:hypothetical protein
MLRAELNRRNFPFFLPEEADVSVLSTLTKNQKLF